MYRRVSGSEKRATFNFFQTLHKEYNSWSHLPHARHVATQPLTVYSPGGGDLYALARHGRSARSLSTSRKVIKQLLSLVLATEPELSDDRLSRCPVEVRPKIEIQQEREGA